MKKNIFIKCFFITLLSVLIMFFAGVGITYISNKNIVSERIVVEAKLASALINHEEEYSTLDVFRNQDDCRVTVISMMEKFCMKVIRPKHFLTTRTAKRL